MFEEDEEGSVLFVRKCVRVCVEVFVLAGGLFVVKRMVQSNVFCSFFRRAIVSTVLDFGDDVVVAAAVVVVDGSGGGGRNDDDDPIASSQASSDAKRSGQ